jgi:hypothetical protein
MPDLRAALAGGVMVLGFVLILAVVSGSRPLEQAAAWTLTGVAIALGLIALAMRAQARR